MTGPVDTDEDGAALEPPAGHVRVRRAPSRRGGLPRVYLDWRSAAGELRAIPFAPSAARRLASELQAAADATEPDGRLPVPVTP